MFHSPKKLRSKSKGQPVTSSGDKQKSVRSLSSSSSSTSLDSEMPPKTDKASEVVDPAVIAAIVDQHISSSDVINQLMSRLLDKLKSVVEEAVRAALTVVNREMGTLRDEVKSLRAKVEDLDGRLADRTDDLEQYQRRSNLRIFGVEERAGEDTDAIVVDLCREKLGVDLPLAAICRSHRVGKTLTPKSNEEKRHRPIIVRFTSYRDRRLVYAAKKKLKGSKTTIREDLTARRMEVLRSATAQYGVRNTWTQDGRVLWIDKDGRKGMATRLIDLQ